jgi:hypothetical protein
VLFAGLPQINQPRADPRKVIVKPRPAATIPPISIQTALSVGEPVKNLETSEENEFVALTPTMIRMMPPTRRASATSLFIKKEKEVSG